MKRFITSLFLIMISATALFAQVPQKFTYQAAVRDAAGNLVSNAPVGVRVSILKSSASGVAVYCETHLNNTNATGLLSLEIGGGTVVGGEFASLDWAHGPYFLKTEMDVTGGTNYTMTSSQQLLSVPYALYAGNAIDLEERMNNVEKLLDSLKTNEGFGKELLPLVNTGEATNIEQYDAVCEGNVVWEGGTSVTARGVCWSTSQNPTVADSHTTNGRGTGSFTSSLSGLTGGTTYYVRAYATNNEGTAYGVQKSFTTSIASSFTCGTSTVSDYDNNTYHTVQIGQQCWMKENLKTTHYSDGTSILEGSTTSSDVAYWYYPDNNSSNKDIYGLLYNWKAVMHDSTSSDITTSAVQGICPKGWHVPSNAEWMQLADYVGSQSSYQCDGSSSNIAKALASTTGWNSASNTCAVGNNPSSNNATGFSAVPAGSYSGSYFNLGNYAFFWSSTQYSSNGAYRCYMVYNNVGVYHDLNSKISGFVVRCLRDVGTTTTIPTVTTTSVTEIASSTATCGGNVTSDGGATVTARGVCWSTSQNPTIADSHTTDGSGTGSFSSSITGLTPGTTYYVRAYATNSSAGTVYGNLISFTTKTNGVNDGKPCPSAATVTDHEGNVYNTVQIGNQCWMKENMRCKTSPSTGTTILETNSNSSSYTGKKAYYVNGNSSNTYGLLYNWNAAVDTFNTAYGETSTNTEYSNAVRVTFSGNRRGICPQGWHVPRNAEWTQLEDYVGSQSEYQCNGSSSNIAKALASTTGWYSSSNSCAVGNNPSSNDATGFSAVPAGYYRGYTINFGGYASFWSATQNGSDAAYGQYLYYSYAYVTRYGTDKNSGYSVRCLQD